MKAKLLLSVIMATVLLLAPCAFSKQAVQDSNSLKKFKTALEQSGFEVRTGDVVSENATKAWCDKKINNALYANIEPYLQVLVPPLLEWVPMTPDFQLDPDEAIVVIGLTPPPVKYFSYTPYIDLRKFPDREKVLMASIGDPVNIATINTIGSPPFNSPVALIFTPDQGTDARVRKALLRAGYPEAIINTVVLPESMLRLGHGKLTSDVLLIMLRTAIWEKESDRDSYIAHPPLTAFRVTPHSPTKANPFPPPELRVRGTGHTEMHLMNKLDQLRQGIIDTMSNAHKELEPVDIVLFPMCNEGHDLIQRGIEMCIDTRDAFYVGAGLPEWDKENHITLEDGEFLMIYGTNHVATGKATYTNTNVYAVTVTQEDGLTETAKMTVGAIDDRKYPGTADPYLPAGDPDAHLMYAYKISRNCDNEDNCLQLYGPDDCPRLLLDHNTVLGVFTRMYLEPSTRTGPAMPEVLYDRVIKFSKTPTP